MERLFAIVLVVLLWALPSVAAHGGSTVHSENTKDAHNVPALPNATQSVSIHLYTVDDSKIDVVNAIYCRVQNYACAPALRMVRSGPNIFDGIIPWNKDFFQGVTEVGYKFEIKYVDGRNETTPISHFPERPADLPEGADKYYYYTIKPVPESAAPGPAWLLPLLLLPLAWRRRG